jgi:hypothetical protein
MIIILMTPFFHAQAASTAAVYLNIRITQLTKCIVNNHSYINLKEDMRGITEKYVNVKVI